VDEIKRKTLELAREEEALRVASQRVQEAEAKRQKDSEINAERRVMELKRLDALARQRRLEQINKTEDALHESIRLKREEREIELKRIEAEMQRKSAEAEYSLEARKEVSPTLLVCNLKQHQPLTMLIFQEEALLNLELQANLRMQAAQESVSIEVRR
jgi:hypothetical protein